MMRYSFLVLCALCVATGAVSRGKAAPLEFVDLGEPARVFSLPLEFVTGSAGPGYTAWGVHEAHDNTSIIGIRVETGKARAADLTQFGKAHVQMTLGADGNIYAYAGNPGHFVKYDLKTEKLTDLGIPARPASYSIGSAVGPKGEFYVGTFPQTCLVECDTLTGRIRSFGRLSPDERQCYALSPAAGADGTIYCPVGLHHRELWAIHPITGAKKQILPERLTMDQGIPQVWIGVDGDVYGRAGRAAFRCYPDRIEIGPVKPERSRKPLQAGNLTLTGLDAGGQIRLLDSKSRKVRQLQTDYSGAPRIVYSVSCERDGKIYGGTAFPAFSFAYDKASGTITNLGRISTASVQVYDTLNTPGGLLLSAYMPASLDLYDPGLPIGKNNPRPIASIDGQERPMQVIQGPDGMIYTGTVPSKGRLGGALVRANPRDFTTRVWTNLITNQSLFHLVSIPETGEILCSTSVTGGSSAIPSEKEACIFLWHCSKEKVMFRAQPVRGAKSYGSVVRAANGMIYGVANDSFYVFDPSARKVVFTGTLPVKNLRFPGLSDDPVGPRNLIYGLGDDAVFAIDPSSNTARIVGRDPSVRRAQGFFVSRDLVLYYGAGSRLMRCNLAGTQ